MHLKQFVDMNALYHINFDHTFVLDVHFTKSAFDSDVTAACAKLLRFNMCVVHL